MKDIIYVYVMFPLFILFTVILMFINIKKDMEIDLLNSELKQVKTMFETIECKK